MAEVMSVQRKKIHPHKFTLWVAIGSLVMMFAGLTSAYIVKRGQGNWQLLELPQVFWYSTIVILLSSLTVQMAIKAFKEREMMRYKWLVTITAILGVVFLAMQVYGFLSFEQKDIKLVGMGSNASYSFLLAIAGLHGLHVLGGVIALLVIFVKAFNRRTRTYNSVPIEVAGTYWHFVDILWIYLFVFFNWMR
ncbi:MAG: heme-copper oxidase subunit III [Chitinophagaceae bacterium]|nr:heme-copper oxidase subunit III [Chitinophagaceae bacterium]